MKKNNETVVDELNDLTPAELIIIGEHLKLGTDHIKKHLNEKEFEALVRSGKIQEESLEKMRSDKKEIAGNLIMFLNAIFTATFGLWMALSGFWGFDMESFTVVSRILVLAIFLGIFLSYHNFKHTKDQTVAATQRQQLNCLQLTILDKIHKKRREEADEIKNELNHFFSILAKHTSFEKSVDVNLMDGIFKSKETIKKLILDIDKIIKEKTSSDEISLIRKVYSEDLSEIKSRLEKDLANCFHSEELEVIHESPSSLKKKNPSRVIGKLITILPEKSTYFPSWIRSNWRQLITSFIPTVLGGFGSLFVYLGEGPQVLKIFGYKKLFEILTDSRAKSVEFLISILVTGFFAASFIHMNRKAIKRYQEIEKTQNIITQREGLLTVLDAHLLKLKDVRNDMKIILSVFKTMEKISSLLKKTNEPAFMPK